MLIYSEDDDFIIPIITKANSNMSAISKINFEASNSKTNFKSSIIQNPIQTNISNDKTSAT